MDRQTWRPLLVVIFMVPGFVTSQIVPARLRSIPQRTNNICIASTFCQENTSSVSDGWAPDCCMSCYCHENCEVDRNCCFPPLTTNLPFEGKSCVSSELIPNPEREHLADSFYMVTRCAFNNNQQNLDVQGCYYGRDLDSRSGPPVYSPATKKTYFSEYCARCNGVEDTISWDTKMACLDAPSTGSTFTEILRTSLTDPSCIVMFRPPNGLTFMNDICAEEYIGACNKTGYWQTYNNDTEASCSGYLAPVSRKNVVFANVHCYICNQNDTQDNELLFGCQSDPLLETVKFSFLFDFQLFSEFSVDNGPRMSQTGCREYEIEDYLQPGLCRLRYCPEAQVRRKGTCTVAATPLKSRYKAVFNLSPLQTSDPLYLSDFPKYQSDMRSIIHYAGRSSRTSFIGPIAYSKSLTSNKTSITTLVVKVFFQQALSLESALDSVEKILKNVWTITVSERKVLFRAKIHDEVFHSCTSRSCKPAWASVIDRPHEEYYSFGRFISRVNLDDFFVLTRPFFCEQVQLFPNEYLMDYDSGLLFLSDGRFLSPGNYVPRRDKLSGNMTVRICVDDFEKLPRKISNLNHFASPYLEIVSVICISASVVSLVATLLIFCLMKRFTNVPGLNTMFLSVQLLISQLLFVLGASRREPRWLCRSIGLIMHFSWLSTFFWMNVCCFHVFRRFYLSFSLEHTVHVTKTVLLHVAFVYLMAGLFVSANVVTSLMQSDFKTIGYGKDLCYIDTALMRGVTFGLPLGVVLLMNFVFFSLVVLKIYRTKSSVSHLNKERNYIAIYLRLSTLTGLAWLSGFAYELLQTPALEYVFIILNASQGIFIMAAFVFKRDTFRFCGDTFNCKRSESD